MKNWKKLAAMLVGCAMLAVTGGCAAANTTPAETVPAKEEPTEAAADTPTAADTEAPSEENAPAAAESDSATITVTDHLGNTVEVPRDINRIVVGNIYPLPSVLTVFFDSGEKIVGMADVSMKAAQNGLLGELYPEVLDYAVFGHCGDESGHKKVLDALGAQPLLNLGLRLGEGTGAICAYPIVQSAVHMINEMDDFRSASITKYF